MSAKPFDPTIDVDRRRDQEVRNAINCIQEVFFDPQAYSEVLSILAEHLVAITGSDDCTIFTASADCVAPIIPEGKRRLHRIHSGNSGEFACAGSVSHWLAKDAPRDGLVFFNAPLPGSYASLLREPERTTAIIVLPVVSEGKLRALCFLRKRRGSYTADTTRRLIPLTNAAICALQSADSVASDCFSVVRKDADGRFLSTLLATSPTAILVIDQNRNIVVSNAAANAIFSPEVYTLSADVDAGSFGQFANKKINDFIPGFNSLFQYSNQPTHGGTNLHHRRPARCEEQIARRADGSEFLVDIAVFRYAIGDERLTTLQVQDLTNMRESARKYQRASQQLDALTQLVPVGIIRVDVDWNCVYANDKWYEFSGQIIEEAMAKGWINALHSDDIKSTLESLRVTLQTGNDFQTEVRLVSPLGQIRCADLNTQVLYDGRGNVQGFLATFADITERLVQEERLRHVAEYDTLTGLANRNLFQDRLQQAFFSSERSGLDITVLFLDLDGFKDVNDSLGHEAGDKLLEQVAERLLNTLRRNDTIARFGGDEFVVLLASQERETDIEGVAKKVIDAIARPYMVNDSTVYVTASVGIATGSAANTSPEQLLKHADAALYTAKAEGKNNFQLFNDELDKKAKGRIQLANQLRIALQNDRFFLVFQPQASIHSQDVIGFETLLRFRDEHQNVVLPGEFIPILEETGMIIDVGKWVVDRACMQLREWKKQNLFPKHGSLSINVSPKQLLDDSLASGILKACNKYEIDPHELLIELTESVIIDKPQKVQRAMGLLKYIGVKLALDDFGTGYSSLTYLQRYPFDHIKIDKSFVFDLLTDESDAKITKAIIALAHSLGLKITAEGVTDFETLSLLKAYGADYYQGYFLGKPVSAKQALKADATVGATTTGSKVVDIKRLARSLEA